MMKSILFIGLIGLAVFLGLIFIFRRNKFILVFLFLAAGLGTWFGLKEYNRANKSLSKTKADLNITAAELVREFELNDSAANKKYLGKVLEVKGNVKEVKNDEGKYYTIFLGHAEDLASVRCSMDSTQNADASRLTTGASLTVRGVCTGFDKNELGLGSDVILNRAVIVSKIN